MSSSTPQLWELYDQWKRLTADEGAAIERSNWLEVSRCQAAKQKLQPEIIRVTERARSQCSGPPEIEQITRRIRAWVNELIALESGNSQSLQKKIDALESERGALDQTSSRLRRMRGAYLPPQAAVWERYS